MSSVAVSETGAIYVVGSTCGVLDRTSNDEWFGRLDAFVRKYEADGDLVWSRQFGTRDNDAAWGVAVGPDGNPVVSGFSGGAFSGLSSAGKDDIFLRKFDQNGNVLWTQQFGSSEDDRSFDAVAVGPDGSIYVSGNTDGVMNGNRQYGDQDAFVAKFSSSGIPQWVRQIGTSALDEASTVQVSSTGQVYVGGGTDGNLPGQTSAGLSDSFIVAYDLAGELLWTKQFGSADHETAMAIDTDTTGTVFVAGIRFFPGGGDAYIRIFDSNGASIRSYEFGTDGFDFLFDIQVKPDGQVIAVGYSEFGEDQQILIVRLDSDSETPALQHFGTQTNDTALGVALGEDGTVYVAGELNRPGSSGRATEKAGFVVRLAE